MTLTQEIKERIKEYKKEQKRLEKLIDTNKEDAWTNAELDQCIGNIQGLEEALEIIKKHI